MRKITKNLRIKQKLTCTRPSNNKVMDTMTNLVFISRKMAVSSILKEFILIQKAMMNQEVIMREPSTYQESKFNNSNKNNNSIKTKAFIVSIKTSKKVAITRINIIIIILS